MAETETPEHGAGSSRALSCKHSHKRKSRVHPEKKRLRVLEFLVKHWKERELS